MLHKFIIIWKAINALLAWTMIARLLYFLDIIFSDSKTVDALWIWSMIAMRFFNFFVCFWLIGLLFLKCRSRLRWWSVNHFSITCLLLKFFRLLYFWLRGDNCSHDCILIGNINHVSISLFKFRWYLVLLKVELGEICGIWSSNLFRVFLISEYLQWARINAESAWQLIYTIKWGYSYFSLQVREWCSLGYFDSWSPYECVDRNDSYLLWRSLWVQ